MHRSKNCCICNLQFENYVWLKSGELAFCLPCYKKSVPRKNWKKGVK